MEKLLTKLGILSFVVILCSFIKPLIIPFIIMTLSYLYIINRK